MNGAQGEGEEDTRQHELVIIRRRGGGEDAPHKGGVWKIAHADFMTALMAFFLVMWLITATDEKTITGVANYFNPMRLTDQAARPKGVFTMEPGSEQPGDANKGPERGTAEAGKRSGGRAGNAPNAKEAEAALLADPYEALDEIAAQAGKATAGHRGGDAFRDPFDPDLRYQPAHRSEAPGHDGQNAGAAQRDTGADPATDQDGTSADLQRRIEEAVKQSGFAAIPGIDVRATPDGLLISITDQPDFEMFGIASARPEPELVVLMEKIGKLIGTRAERIVVRGHTDGRQYRAGGYDNWRLSTARAHMAHYMLVRSGVSEQRFARIEGRADRDLAVAGDPLAAQNRRIEVLLVKGKS
jgi:chemotaxis protein MotB